MARSTTAGVVLGILGAGFVACGAFGIDPSGTPDASLLSVSEVHDPYSGFCVGNCLPDPGSAPPDCTGPDSVDRLDIESFDNVSSNTTGFPQAADMYMYSDGTARPLFVYGDGNVVDGGTLSFDPHGYQPQTERDDFCGVAAPFPCETHTLNSNYVLHMVGGALTGPPGEAGVDPICGSSLGYTPAAFRGYGGGIGVSMAKLNGRDKTGGDTAKGFCVPTTSCPGGPAGGYPNGVHPEVCPPAPPMSEDAVWRASLDVSAYDGVAFWARRGPNSQLGIHVLVADKYTDDDLSYLTYRDLGADAPRHCERVRQCSCTSIDKTCTFVEDAGCVYDVPFQSQILGSTNLCAAGPGYYCLPLDSNAGQFGVSLNGAGSNVFCQPTGPGTTNPLIATECNQPYAAYPNDFPTGGFGVPILEGGVTSGMCPPAAGQLAPQDPQFYGRPCTPYAFANGNGAAYCFDPATDPPPADPTETCGDFWMSSVDITTDWTYYKIPFTNMRQQGFAKRTDQLDLHSVSLVRFTWDPGWVDYWIDLVSFYRERQ